MVLIQSISVYSLPVVLGEEVKNISIVTSLEMYGGLMSVHLTYAVNMLLIKKRMFQHIIVAVQLLSCVQIFVTPWIVAHQASLSMGFPRQEYWSGWPFPPPGDLPDPGNELISPALAGGFFYHEPPGKPFPRFTYVYKLLELFTDGCALY